MSISPARCITSASTCCMHPLSACAAWVLTSIRGASATTKYWIWVVTAFNFVIPAGALIDKLWAPHLTWAHPLGAIGGPVWEMTEGRRAVVLAVIWIAGAFAMSMRLISRIRTERRECSSCGPLDRPQRDVQFHGRWHPGELRQQACRPRSQRHPLSAYLASHRASIAY